MSNRIVRGGGNADPTIAALQRANDKHMALKRQVAMLRSSGRRPTMPNYDLAAPLDAVQGQHALFDDGTETGNLVPMYYTDAAGWRPMGGSVNEVDSDDLSIIVTNPNGPIVDLEVNYGGFYATNDGLTLPASGGGPVDFTAGTNSGDSILQYTTGGATATNPKFVHDGFVVVSVVVQVDSGDPGFTAGTGIDLDLQCPAPLGVGNTLLMFDKSHLDVAGNPYHYLQAVGIHQAFGGQGLEFAINNEDPSVDHNIYWRMDMIQFIGDA